VKNILLKIVDAKKSTNKFLLKEKLSLKDPFTCSIIVSKIV
jgi:hypothetical protein